MNAPSRLILTMLSLVSFNAMAAPIPYQPDYLAFSGIEGSGNHALYGTIGAVAPLPGTASQLGNGWVGRIITDAQTYRYKATRKIDATVYGSDLSLGYQHSANQGWWGIYAGAQYQDTRLSPSDAGNKANGGMWGFKLQGEVEQHLTPDFKINLNGVYTLNVNNGYWTRARLLYRLHGSLFIGPEAIFLGDENYTAWQAGITLLGIQITNHAQLGFKAGMRKTKDFKASPYGGLELGATF